MKFDRVNKIFNLKNRVIVITGSAGLLGSQYAQILSDAGADLVLVDTNVEKNRKLKNGIKKKFQTNPICLDVDITSKNEVKKMALDIKKEFGRVDGLVNNAFLNHAKSQAKKGANSFETFPIEIWNKALELNITGVFLCCQEIGKMMAKQRSGVIVNISSIYGFMAPDMSLYEDTSMGNPAAYSASKGGLIQLTKWLAVNMAPSVRVNSISPGGIERNQPKAFIEKYQAKTPLGRMGSEEDLKGSIIFLASDLSKYVTGQNIIVDGGWSC